MIEYSIAPCSLPHPDCPGARVTWPEDVVLVRDADGTEQKAAVYWDEDAGCFRVGWEFGGDTEALLDWYTENR